MKTSVFKTVARQVTNRGLIAAAGAGLLLPLTTPAQTVGKQVVRGHVPAITALVLPIGSLAGTNRMNLAIGLPLRNTVALSNLL